MAAGVATKMKALFGDSIDVAIHLIDSPEAVKFVLRGATTVFLNDVWVPLDVATTAARMQEYLEHELTLRGNHEGS